MPVDPSVLVALLNALEDRDLVRRRRDPADRRRHIVEITEAGASSVTKLDAAIGRVEDRVQGAGVLFGVQRREGGLADARRAVEVDESCHPVTVVSGRAGRARPDERHRWNDFLLPLVILSDPGSATLPLVQYVFPSQFQTNYPAAFAGHLMAMAPLLIVYVFAQRRVISGVTRGAVK